VLLTTSALRVFEYSDGTLTAGAIKSVGSGAVAMTIANISNDGYDEIAVLSSGAENKVTTYSSTLTQLAQTTVRGTLRAMTFYRAAGSAPLLLTGTANAISETSRVIALADTQR
jgi:hypothetical protein